MAHSTKLRDVLIINCDDTYPLDSVKTLVETSSKTTGVETSIELRRFTLPELAKVSGEVKEKRLLCAILVLHAHESRLSINEKNAGIGYAVLYRALREASEGRVLVVIGADEKSSKSDRKVVSNWVRYKVESQFEDEYLDGRQGFVFSWDSNYYPIHEDAFQQYLRAIGSGLEGLEQAFIPPVQLPSETTDLEKKERDSATQELQVENNPALAPTGSPVTNSSATECGNEAKERDYTGMSALSEQNTSSTSAMGYDEDMSQSKTEPTNGLGTQSKITGLMQHEHTPGSPSQQNKGTDARSQEIEGRMHRNLDEVKKMFPGRQGKLYGVLRRGKLDESCIYPLDNDLTFIVPEYMKDVFLKEKKDSPETDVLIYIDSKDGELGSKYWDVPKGWKRFFSGKK